MEELSVYSHQDTACLIVVDNNKKKTLANMLRSFIIRVFY